ncbi:hypothetical protein BDN72DRAFT_865960 [Pluteus cervinus]|uniref:Uncharacterized protein n=1 Tax=Pluteus cervinus TaxID=181527 RepID=A0ACD2ZY97_9AGAR|nr:hypothetical protein BDN72DRAFT_865960 [Pluteus cervinus]
MHHQSGTKKAECVFQLQVPIITGTTVLHISPSRNGQSSGGITHLEHKMDGHHSENEISHVEEYLLLQVSQLLSPQARKYPLLQVNEHQLHHTRISKTSSAAPPGSHTDFPGRFEMPNIPVLVRPEIMDRQRHCDLHYFHCKTSGRLESPPDQTHFPDLVAEDFFVHWVSHLAQCQIWVASSVGLEAQWEPLKYGHQFADGRQLVVTAKGVPSKVEKSTWEKRYRRFLQHPSNPVIL